MEKMISIEELQNAEFPFRLIKSNYSFIITEFTAVEERNSSYNPKNKSLFLTNCRYIFSNDSDAILAESYDFEIGNLKDLSIIKHDDVKFQSFFNRMKFTQINDLQSLVGLSDVVKGRLTPKAPYVVVSADRGSRNFDFRESIVNKEYVHSEDDSMFIVDNSGFKGSANFKIADSNMFNKSFSKFANYDNFIINVHDSYFPFYIFDKLKIWKGYSAIEKSLNFHFDKFKDSYNKIKDAGFPYIVEKLGNKEDLYVIARRGRDRISYFKLFNVEENQSFFITEFNDVYNQLEENIIACYDPGFTKYIFRLAHEHTHLAIPNDKLHIIYERKDKSPKKELPFAYYSKDDGNYIVFDRVDSGDYKAFDYKSDMYIVLPSSTIDKMFEHSDVNKNSIILNTSDLTKHHHCRMFKFVDTSEVKNKVEITKQNTWNSTGIDLDEVLSKSDKDTFKPIPEELKGIHVELAEDEFFKFISNVGKETATVMPESITEPNAITGTKQSEGKLNYELDFAFITQLAERMAQNKGKYEPYNWKKPIPVEGLKQALFRHVMDYMANDNTLDDGREYGHLESIALNVMMINYQLKYNKKDDKT